MTILQSIPHRASAPLLRLSKFTKTPPLGPVTSLIAKISVESKPQAQRLEPWPNPSLVLSIARPSPAEKQQGCEKIEIQATAPPWLRRAAPGKGTEPKDNIPHTPDSPKKINNNVDHIPSQIPNLAYPGGGGSSAPADPAVNARQPTTVL